MTQENQQSADPGKSKKKDDVGNPPIEQEISLEEFQPKGTLTLALLYFVIIVLMWIFMYFGEFANHGPSIN